MKLTLAEPKLLKDSISIISDLVTETEFLVTKEKFELIAMDPANVSMVIFRMKSSLFAEYEVPEDTKIAINLANFKQVLRRTKSSDVLTLEKDKNKLKIVMKGKNKRSFSLPLINLEEREQKIPDLNSKTKITMPSNVFNDAIEDVDIIGESVLLISDDSKLTVSAKGDLTKAEVFLQKDDEVQIKTEGEQRGKYSIEYLKRMIAASKLVDEVNISFSTEYPLTLEYKKEDLELTFILAPRVDNT